MKTLLPVFLLVALVSIAAACGSDTSKKEASTGAGSSVSGQRVDVDGGSFTDVTAAQMQTMLGNKDFVFVNTHIPYEGEIEGTDLFIPFDEVEQRMSELPAASDAKIVVYCRSGGMSAIAATTLVGLGYTNIWNLDGGMVAWEEAGHPLLQAQE